MRARRVGEQCDDLLEHHPVDRSDQAVALGGRQEAGRPDHAAVRLIGQAHERLVMGEATVGERDDRLVVQYEQVLLECAAQARQPWAPLQPGGRADPLGAGLWHGHPAVALLGRPRRLAHQHPRLG